MTDAGVLETEQTATDLPPEKVKEAANLIGGSVRNILSSWEEYKKPRLINQEGVKEFHRPQGSKGAGLWEVEDVGGYYRYQLTRGVQKGREKFVEDWEVLLQPGGTGVYEDSIISASRIRTKDGQVIGKESPPNNTQGSLNLAIEFARDINGGEIPPTLLQLSSSQNPQVTSYSK